jgi:CRP-like cAMP-binding protein
MNGAAEQVKGAEAPVSRSYKTGEMLFEEGIQGKDKDMYLIQEGKVGVFKNTEKGRVPISVIGAGGLLGEQSIFGDHSRSTTAVAVEPTRVLIISQKCLQKVMEAVPSWLYTMLKVIVEKLHETRRRVEQGAVVDRERALVLLLNLLLPVYRNNSSGKPELERALVFRETVFVSRMNEQEVEKLCKALERRGIISLHQEPGEAGGSIVINDRDALDLYNEYLLLKSRNERFAEADIPEDVIATLSNIAYVAQKSGQETVEGTALYKSALVEDLSDHKDTPHLDTSLEELGRLNLILTLPAEEETLIIFKKEKLSRIKKIREWLPRFETELEAA